MPAPDALLVVESTAVGKILRPRPSRLQGGSGAASEPDQNQGEDEPRDDKTGDNEQAREVEQLSVRRPVAHVRPVDLRGLLDRPARPRRPGVRCRGHGLAPYARARPAPREAGT
jgi:hypothetical protein